MTHRRSTAWFAAKRPGFGTYRPMAWQGWLATALFAAGLVLTSHTLSGVHRLATMVALIVAFMLLCRNKTEGGWRRRR